MLNKAFFKRIVPFVLTFALGLLVASFFVSIAPTFKFKKKRPPCRGREAQTLRYENERLRLENQRLQQRVNATERIILLEEAVPPPPAAPLPLELPVDEAPVMR